MAIEKQFVSQIIEDIIISDVVFDILGDAGSSEVFNLLLEDGNDYLLEDGSFILLE